MLRLHQSAIKELRDRCSIHFLEYFVACLLRRAMYERITMMVLVLLGNALVYGNTLEAFSLVQTLLALRVPGSRVVLVQPPVPVPSCFNNPFIEDAVAAALKESGENFFCFLCLLKVLSPGTICHTTCVEIFMTKKVAKQLNSIICFHMFQA